MQKSSWYLLALECLESDNVATQMYCNFVFLKQRRDFFSSKSSPVPELVPVPQQREAGDGPGPGEVVPPRVAEEPPQVEEREREE